MENSDRSTWYETRKFSKYVQLWFYRFLAKLPLAKALICVVCVTIALFLLTQAFAFRATHSQAVIVSNQRHRFNFKINAKNQEDNVEAVDSRQFMSVQLHGRTGNMMFAYAALLRLSKQMARVAVFPLDHYFRRIFRINAKALERKNVKNWVRSAEKHPYIYDRRLETAGESTADMVELLGYFHSWRYFEEIKNEIRKEFTFQPPILEESSNIIDAAMKRTFGNNVRRSDLILVGLHVRRADMASYNSFLQGYTTASSKYIADAMTYFSQRFNTSRLLFVLCSDDLSWCEENIKQTTAPIAWMKHASDYVHLAILASCNHTIMTVGSFGWWGAWLAGGETVYYKNFPRPSSPLSTDFLAQDYFPPDWIGM